MKKFLCIIVLLFTGTTKILHAQKINKNNINPKINVENCNGEAYDFKVTIPTSPTKPAQLNWDFGDGSNSIFKAVLSTDTEQMLTYTYMKPGNYILTINGIDKDGNEIDGQKQTMTIYIQPCVISVNPNIHMYSNN